MAETATLSLYPASYDTTDYSYASVASSHPLSNAVGNDSSATTYAQWYLTTGNSAETYVYYKFDLSTLPNDISITSSSCIAKTSISSTSAVYIATKNIQYYIGKGTTSLGTSTISSTSATTYTKTLSLKNYDLDTLKSDGVYLKLYAQRSSSSFGTTSNYMRFYGAELTITYELPDTTTHTITITSYGNGTATPSGTVDVEDGNSLTITGTPGEGSYCDTIGAYSNSSPSTSPTFSHTYSNITADTSISVTFSDYTFFIKQSDGSWQGYKCQVYGKDSSGWTQNNYGVQALNASKKYIITET